MYYGAKSKNILGSLLVQMILKMPRPLNTFPMESNKLPLPNGNA